MPWWSWILILLGGYLLVCLLGWLVNAVILSRLRGRPSFVGDALPRINGLVDAERTQTMLWPEEPRGGRYGEIDQTATSLLMALRGELDRANDTADRVAAFTPDELSLVDVLALKGWTSSRSLLAALQERDRLESEIAAAENTANALLEQQDLALGVPERVQADLGAAQAEIRRLYAQWEAEVQAGTQDIQPLGDSLALVDNAIGSSMEAVYQATEDNLLDTVLQAEEQLTMAGETIAQADEDLTAARTHRVDAQVATERVRSAVAEVSTRWQALQEQGVTDSSAAQRVNELLEASAGLDETLNAATVEAFQSATVVGDETLGLATTIMGELEALDAARSASEAGITRGQALATEARDALVAAQEQHPQVFWDSSAADVELGAQLLSDAERQRAQGTQYGYRTAASLAEEAQTTLTAALGKVGDATERAAELASDREGLGDAARAALREKGAELARGWEPYARHWLPLRSAEYDEAVALLDAADAAWSEIPLAFRDQGTALESELPALVTALATVKQACDGARANIERLESGLSVLQDKHQRLDEGLEDVDKRLVAALAARRDTMLPELAERHDTWLADYRQVRATLEDQSQVDYEQAVNSWLPEVRTAGENIMSAYDGDLAHYGRELESVRRRLQRSYQRLERLDPLEPPLPTEDVAKLLADYQSWVSTAEAESANPAAMANLATHQADHLERRIEQARTQISDGRQALNALRRQFQQLGQAVQRTRSSLRSLEHDNQWQQISWVLGSGEEPWERALAAQSASQEATVLDQAVNDMQRAVTLGQEAHDIYSGTEQQLRSALERLNREFRTASNLLDRAQRRANALRQQGESEALTELDEHIANAMSVVSLAQSAGTFEDALQQLSAAQSELERAIG
ncbi:MAG: hypothetical protein ACOX2L_03465 [Anaerolineae bacterium]|jgi:chromosome segregation ATPase|nr:hypothetical protein [Chloroflexota bacterium]